MNWKQKNDVHVKAGTTVPLIVFQKTFLTMSRIYVTFQVMYVFNNFGVYFM